MKRRVKRVQLQEYKKNSMDKTKIRNLVVAIFFVFIVSPVFAQEGDIDFTLDVNSAKVNLPNIFKPNIDLSGRGFNPQASWPQSLAGGETIDFWQKEMGLSGIYRIQYNLWDIYELAKDPESQAKLLANYDEVIRRVSDAGGTVILNLFGTPAGLGKVLDKKSPMVDAREFKELVKSHIRNLSCEKRYNIWYEVWSAPDLDDFFLGRKQEYLNLYRAVATAVKELEAETKIQIPIGGPSVSWWFQNLEGNTIVTPEKSLIYELIKFCYGYRLPLDFISWHAYSSDPRAEQDTTRYHKSTVALIRDWLTYFRFDRNTPLIIDEWNYDSGANVIPERSEKAFIGASYILSRIKKMYDAGLDYQLYFSAEDFFNQKDNVVRNVGIFSFDPSSAKNKPAPKSIYNVFKIMSALGKKKFISLKNDDEFVGMIATKSQDGFVVAIYNYIDPAIAVNYLSRNIAGLNEKERRWLLGMVKSDVLGKILRYEKEITPLRVTRRLKSLLRKAQVLHDRAEKFKSLPRNIKLSLKGLKGTYVYERFLVDDSCLAECGFLPVEVKEIPANDIFQEILKVKPYSVQMLVLKRKADEPKSAEIKTIPVIPVAVDVNDTVPAQEKPQ